MEVAGGNRTAIPCSGHNITPVDSILCLPPLVCLLGHLDINFKISRLLSLLSPHSKPLGRLGWEHLAMGTSGHHQCDLDGCNGSAQSASSCG
jgi:hypothetical protein